MVLKQMYLPGPEYHRRCAVSVICVFNNPTVLRECLTASVQAGALEAPQTEFIPVDNTAGKFSSAGAALNHGASAASNDVLVFVHQDVYLHSLVAVEEAAAALMDDDSIGLLGAIGITNQGRLVGKIRDRIILSGETSRGTPDVDSVDEVLFMARRNQILEEPLSEDHDLSWHAYAVEYGVRMRKMGRRVAVSDIPLTHNSLTVNLDRLAEAHSRIAVCYPEQMPVVTTCGTVRSASEARTHSLISGAFGTQKWRYRWMRESLVAHRLRHRVGTATVLGDIRRDIDEICSAAGLTGALVISGIPDGHDRMHLNGPLELIRRGVSFSFLTADERSIAPMLRSQSEHQTIALTNISFDAIADSAAAMSGRQVMAGFHENTGAWLLTGPAVRAAKVFYSTRRSTPFAMKST
ncbi:MAG: glycosyltransferase [Arthrobacter sp.]|nr:glycosyltransferase [Arthrobacter sp.]MDZ4354382.1 glycosyltransferase [Arthrobacter sp.]